MKTDICGKGHQQAFDFLHRGWAHICPMRFPSRRLKPSEVQLESSNVAAVIDPLDNQPPQWGLSFPITGFGQVVNTYAYVSS
ncbi:uncharacterized protein STEHIDRAFT_163443 [Stereum hirsutum FP-91666 SS1]|uniref:Uncharacterized protein n=1 Tax=Stereum hirsutum (strain FP-91666) TaxID=721885 RepID=R7RW94_STEHR|nr:uncharacterized protein STEHIDRAFT_163443 [Stereum hirsutum FP-91666 SS1]EIM79616.1 hypothetical protein STEHIDRAFT_163443 [Stereum hirsutum FP-91666 SS1]